MSSIVNSVLELIGDTPLVRLNRLPLPGSATVLAKLESRNPGGVHRVAPVFHHLHPGFGCQGMLCGYHPLRRNRFNTRNLPFGLYH